MARRVVPKIDRRSIGQRPLALMAWRSLSRSEAVTVPRFDLAVQVDHRNFCSLVTAQRTPLMRHSH
jgi:hypothetical protein